MVNLKDIKRFFGLKEKSNVVFDTHFDLRESYTNKTSSREWENSFSQLKDVRTLDLCENAYLKEPLTRKGILKRSHDAVENWITIISPNDEIIDVLMEFTEEINLQNKLIDILKNAMIYGVGYAEVVYNDNSNSNEEPTSKEIIDLVLIDPKTITPIYQNDPTKEDYDKLLYYLQQSPDPTIKPVKLHPSRIIELIWDTLSDGRIYVGLIEPMLHIINAKIILDKASGQIPKKVISQIVIASIEGATATELDAWDNALQQMQDAGRFVSSERASLDIKEGGQGLDIKPYSDHLIYQIAGGVGVPFTVLLGAGAGTLSTSEINLRDYYSDIKDIQVKLTPIIIRLFDLELKELNLPLDYEIQWNEIFTDEKNEAEILERKSRALDILLSNGVISVNEAREMLGLSPLEGEEGLRFGPSIKGGVYGK